MQKSKYSGTGFPFVLHLSSSDLELASYQLNESRDNVPGKHEIFFKKSLSMFCQ